MKKLIKTILIIIGTLYFMLFRDGPALQIAYFLIGVALLDRGAAWCDRKVPATDPRKHT
jgi:hypothetical protein